MTDLARGVRQVGRLGPARRCNGVPLTKTCTTYAYAQSAGPGVRRELGLGFGEYALSNTTFQDMQQALPRMLPLERCNRIARAHTHPYAPDQDFIKYTQRPRVVLSMRNDRCLCTNTSKQAKVRARITPRTVEDKVAMHIVKGCTWMHTLS